MTPKHRFVNNMLCTSVYACAILPLPASGPLCQAVLQPCFCCHKIPRPWQHALLPTSGHWPRQTEYVRAWRKQKPQHCQSQTAQSLSRRDGQQHDRRKSARLQRDSTLLYEAPPCPCTSLHHMKRNRRRIADASVSELPWKRNRNNYELRMPPSAPHLAPVPASSSSGWQCNQEET